MMATPTPIPAFVHVDLDGLWTLARVYGYPEGDHYERDPVFTHALPRLLDLMDELGFRATFFICGRDLDHPAKRTAIAAIARRGHELANHSWSHRVGLERLGDDVLEREIRTTSEALTEVAGRPPVGFRAPGYDAGPRMLEMCSRCGLRYDGSNLPTRWGPVLRWLAGRLRRKLQITNDKLQIEKKKALDSDPDSDSDSDSDTQTDIDLLHPSSSRLQTPDSRLYAGGGSMKLEWFRPEGGGEPVLRLPLAVSPWLRLPLHASLGMMLGRGIVLRGLKNLARRPEPITYLLHGMDLLGPRDLRDRLPDALANEQAFARPLADRTAFVRSVLQHLKSLRPIALTSEWLRNQDSPAD